jgi:superfamily II DNA/RNA helicase
LQKFEAWKQWLETTNDKAKHSLAQPIDILIATDTLSEGQNLQDCDTVINYDIHWNPVRIIQRVGRIDRLGSPNQHIFTYNFWPAKDINDYLDLQGRIEKRMASMQLVGSEITKDLTDDFTLMSEDDALAQRQNNRMLEQMQNTLADIDSEGSFGFDDLSFETFRQELFAELHRSRDKYLNMPKAVFTGFLANEDSALTAGIIALLGYPAKNKQTIYEPYKEHQLVYFDFDGNSFGVNEKEILAILAAHKHNDRDNEGLSLIDKGEATEIARYSQALKAWLKKQHTEELKTSEGQTQTLAGAKTMDLLARLKTGSKSSLQTVQQEGNSEQKYQPQSFDLVVWFGVRGGE